MADASAIAVPLAVAAVLPVLGWLLLEGSARRAARQVIVRAKDRRVPGVSVRRRVLRFDHRGPAASGQLIFLHGYGMGDPACYAGAIDRLRDAGFVVLYPVYQHSYLPFGYAAALERVLDDAVPGWADTSSVVVGHSQGASLAVDLVVRRLSHVRGGRLLLVTPGEGTRSDGTPLLPGMILPWGRAPLLDVGAPASQVPVSWHVLVVSTAGDQLVGRGVADRIVAHLGRDPHFAIERLHHAQADAAGRPGHFFLSFSAGERIDAGMVRRLSGAAWREVGESAEPPALARRLLDWAVAGRVPCAGQ